MFTTETQTLMEMETLLKSWAYCRDNGLWEPLAATFTPGGTIAVTWFQGTHTDFVAASRAMPPTTSRHVITGSLCAANGARGWAETHVQLLGWGTLGHVPVHWTSHFRFLDQFQLVDGRWRIHKRTAVYDMDFIAADEPGTALSLDRERLDRLPRPYRYLAYRLELAGRRVPADLPTGGSPAEARVRQELALWLHG